MKGADPRGPLCKAAESRADDSRQRLKAARDDVAKAGVVPMDPQARRLAAVLPVTEEAIQLYQPLVLPVAISVLGLLLISAGAHAPKPPSKVVQRRKGKRKQKPRLGSFAAVGERSPSAASCLVTPRSFTRPGFLVLGTCSTPGVDRRGGQDVRG